MSDYAFRGSAFTGDILGGREVYDKDEPEEIVQGLDLDELDEERVKGIIRQELESALGQEGGTLATDRLEALKYYNGEPFGNEVPDRSQVVMRTVLEAVEWVLPALIRIFSQNSQICVVEPPQPGLEDKAKEATDYLNHIFYRDNDGFMILHDWFKDALLERLGWIKYYYDTQKTTETKSYTGLTKEEYDGLLGQDDDVEVVKLTKYTQDDDEFNLDRPYVPPPPPPPPMPPGLSAGSVPPLPGGLMPPGPPGPAGVPGRAAPQTPPTPPPPLPRIPPTSAGLAPSGPSNGAVPLGMPLSSFPPPNGFLPGMLPPLPPPPIELFDCTLRITREFGVVRVCNIPPEEMLFSRRAKRGDIPFISHRRRWTYSDLIEQGYDAECLDLIPFDDTTDFNAERTLRHRGDTDFPSYQRRDSGREIWVEESYCKFSLSDDGKTTELYRVVTAGKGLVILTRDGKPAVECCDEAGFVSICPIPSPHTLVGQSLADLTMDLQLIKSTLIRQMIDNAFLSNWPRIEVADDSVNENTYDDLLTLRPGGIVRTRRLGGVQPMMIPFTADKTFPLVEYLDQTQEIRTGVARHNQGINPDDLNKTATGVSLLQQAAAQRVELFARIFAQGVEELMRGILRLVTRHQQKEKIIRVTGGWLKVDPKQWREDMPVTVSVGLGTGNRDQMLSHLMQIIQLQGTIVQQQQGVSGPLVYSQNVFDALKALQENAGFKSSFFADPSQGPPPGTPPPPPPKPDPEMAKAQAQMQALGIKAQADAQANQAKAQADIQALAVKSQLQERLLGEKANAEAAIQQQRLDHEKQLAFMKANHEVELQREKAANDLAVGMARVKIEGEAKLKEIELKFAAGAYDQQQRQPAPNGSSGAV